jgi:bifunctional pyridoxal-dependent enzyme with beta-cystathionase and maltose regulon repressor activities
MLWKTGYKCLIASYTQCDDWINAVNKVIKENYEIVKNNFVDKCMNFVDMPALEVDIFNLM